MKYTIAHASPKRNNTHVLPVHLVHYTLSCTCSTIFLLMGQQVNLHHDSTTHQQKLWHLKVILCQSTTRPIRYETYQLTRIQIQVLHILLRHINLTHQTTSTLNEYNVQKRIKINSRVKRVFVTLSKSAQILQPSYLHMCTNQRPKGLNWIRIH